MGISSDIVPKRLPRQQEEPDRLTQKDKAPDILLPATNENAPTNKIATVERKPTTNRNNDLADEFFDKTFFKGPKKERKMEPSPETKPENNNSKKTSPLQTKFLWSLFGILVLILAWQNYPNLKNFYNGIITPKEAKSSSATTTAATSDSTLDTIQGETPTQSTSTPTDSSSTTATADSNSGTSTSASSAPASTSASTTSVNKSQVSLEVLNGNGVTGRAATVSKLLSSSGFTVAKTTNAKRFTYSTTIIYFHTGKEAEANSVKSTLSDYSVTTQQDDDVTAGYDIVVVVGKK